LKGLASLAPATLAVMHGSSFSGNCQQALLDLATVMEEVLDRPSYVFLTEKVGRRLTSSLNRPSTRTPLGIAALRPPFAQLTSPVPGTGLLSVARNQVWHRAQTAVYGLKSVCALIPEPSGRESSR
jgi:hypothetical protein